jgi:hypothetical protein
MIRKTFDLGGLAASLYAFKGYEQVSLSLFMF